MTRFDAPFRVLLMLLDLAAIGLPMWHAIHSVSVAYGLVIVILQPIIFRENSLYWRHGEIYRTFGPQLAALLQSYVTIFIVFAVVAFIAQGLGSRPRPDDLLAMFAAVVAFNIAFRMGFAALLRLLGSGPASSYLVIGGSPRARLIADALKGEAKRTRFLGYIVAAEDDSSADLPSEEIVGTLDAIDDAITLLGPDAAIVVLDDKPIEEILDVVDRVAALPVVGYVYNDSFGIVRQRYKSRAIGPYTVATIELGSWTPIDTLLKRVMDIAGASLFLALAAPLVVPLAITVKLSSRGPAFYLSERVKGRAGRAFKMYKFRSMRQRDTDLDTEMSASMDRLFADTNLDKEFTKSLPTDAITGVGRFMRKSSLDELPQLINVLKGEMSLVGPRPSPPYEYKRYAEWHKRRLDAKPGMTGLWQVVARSKTNFDEQAILDIYYIGHRTLWFDIEILFKTIPVVLYGRGGG
jgi:undecaprenyl-phosphate galactose phosphotransferase